MKPVSSQNCLSPRSRRGRISPPVAIFVGSCAISAGVFFLVTNPMVRKAQVEEALASAQTTAAKKASVLNQIDELPAPDLPAMQRATDPSVVRAVNPADLADQVMVKLKEKDFAAAAALTAPDETSQGATRQTFEKLFTEMGVTFPADGAAREIGQSGARRIFALPLMKDGAGENLTLEMELDPQARAWKVASMALPFYLGQAVAAGASQFRVGGDTSALGYTDSFVKALLDRDFSAATSMTDSVRVPPERIAGLCILMEETGYRLAKDRPLVETAASDAQALVIAKLEEAGKNPVEFGMTLTRSTAEAPWLIVDLNMSSLLSEYMTEADTSVPYSPIVKLPTGGESIVVYFAYDDATLHDRARRQISIIADILKASPTRHINISGYTDAHGSDRYNMNLSGRRAFVVSTELRRLGVPDSQIRAVAKGKEDPLSPNTDTGGSDNPLGRAKNRRAEIYLNF